MKIAVKPFNTKMFYNNGFFKINNRLNIFYGFDKRLKKKNVELKTIDVQKKPDIYIYCDVPYPWEIKLWFDLITHPLKNILFCFESPLINPFSHLRILKLFFKKIYTWDDNAIDRRKYFKLYIPQLSPERNERQKNFKNKKFIVLINAKKTNPFVFKPFSFGRKDLYKERLHAINFFQKNISSKFSLYGKGWNQNEFSVYKGEIPIGEKNQIVSGFKFSICFENTIAPGYITEKIFDCFQARNIPIYWGAPNIEQYIPTDCFIDFRKFKGYPELLKFLNNMNEVEYSGYIKRIEKLLKDKKFHGKWYEDGFEKTILEAIR